MNDPIEGFVGQPLAAERFPDDNRRMSLARPPVITISLLIAAFVAAAFTFGRDEADNANLRAPIGFQDFCRIRVGVGSAASLDMHGRLMPPPADPDDRAAGNRIEDAFDALAAAHPSADAATRCKRPRWLAGLSGVKWLPLQAATPSRDLVSAILANPDLLRTSYARGDGFPEPTWFRAREPLPKADRETFRDR